MYRSIRCSNGLSRRVLVASVLFCALYAGSLWLRCDERPAENSTRRNSDGGTHLTSDDDVDDDEEVVEYDDSVFGERDRDANWVSTGLKRKISDARSPRSSAADAGGVGEAGGGYHQIDCLINDEKSVRCRQDDVNGEIYVPFGFISKYFEVYGKMANDGSRFLWQHSYSRVYPVDETYSPFGVFMSFDHYNVEVRDRVKCISGAEGVPVSTQWGPQGYFYPTQIAQYALSHYSKYLKMGDSGESGAEPLVIEDAEDSTTSRWTTRSTASLRNVLDDEKQSRVIEFRASESSSDLSISLPDDPQSPRFYLSLNVRFAKNGSVVVNVATGRRRLFRIHYVVSNSMLSVVGESDIFYGIGTDRFSWSTLGRDVAVDLQKGVNHRYAGRKKRPPKIIARRIVSIELLGAGRLDNLTLSVDRHLAKFFNGADWLVHHQDPTTGGWPIPVSRTLSDGRMTLPAGWLSAMAQGQAMSALVRAYGRTRRREYIDSAILAIRPFGKLSTEGGVLARFMERYDWYEEYPTTPPCFVLNGFIYALVGLFDVATSAPTGDGQTTAVRLYAEGLRSLRAMLPMYDTGTGTVYDLRHLTLSAGGQAAPNRARWDYHSTHINQLAVLVSILRREGANSDEIDAAAEFEEVARRWKSYMKGRRAPHN